MSDQTLRKLREIFPNVKLHQTYGSTELGILRSKSRDDGSTWVKVGGEGYQTRVVDGMLEIKAESAMIGYFNAPSPFTEDGWYKTGDVVEQDGEWLKILGRKTELINVGGEKVSPVEIEGLIEEIEGIYGAVVSSAENPIAGKIVKAKIYAPGLDLSEVRYRVNTSLEHLPRYMIPQMIELSKESLYSDRGKKVRQ